MTWDEGLYALCGSLAIKNLVSRNFSPKAWGFELHPPLVMYFFGLAYGLFALLKSFLRHGLGVSMETIREEGIASFHGRGALLVIRLPSVLLGSLSSVVLYYLTYDIWGNQGLSTLAALVLALLPVFIAWSSLAMLEGGLTFFILIALWSLLKGFGPNLDITYIILSGISLGMAMASREFGLFLPIVSLPWLGVYAVATGFGAVPFIVLWLLLGVAVFYITWPFLWRDPVGQFLKGFRDISGMASGGRWHFFLANFAATVPLITIPLAGLGLLTAASGLAERPQVLVIVAWFLIPLAAMSTPFTPKRGGVYELTFLMPAFSTLAALGVLEASQLAGPLLGVSSTTLSLALGSALLLWLLFSDLRIAPYHMDYYSALGEWLLERRNARIIPFGWWGEGMDAAMEYIDSHALPNSLVWIYGPKATALYHSRRANLLESVGEDLFHERARMGVEVPLSEETHGWRRGDLRLSLPYYQQERLGDLRADRLRDQGVGYILIYRWALNDPEMTCLNKANYEMVKEITTKWKPVFTSRIKGKEVCWVYKVGAGDG